VLEREEKSEWAENQGEENNPQRGKPMSTSEKGYILLKIGGSSITDKNIPYKLRKNVISRLAKELSESKYLNLLISHGSGSFGHTSAIKYGGMKGYKNKLGIAKVFADAAKINEIMTEALVKEGIPAVSIRPRGIVMAKNGREHSNYFQIIEEMLNQGLVPIICGDVIIDKSWKTTIFSGEKTLNLLALYLKQKGFKIERIIQIGETDGFLDEKGKTIPEINSKNWNKIKKNIFKTKKMDVTGGMEHKIEEALVLSKKGIKTSLISHGDNDLFNLLLNRNINQTLIS
jgi:isopentenyl phosphate kinase